MRTLSLRSGTIVLLIALFMFTLAAPAAAMDGDACGHEAHTLESLEHCVHHALDMEHITSAGVAGSLLAKITAAQAALDRSQPSVAVLILQAFVAEVQAQAGVHIDPEHADHLISHAQMVIDNL